MYALCVADILQHAQTIATQAEERAEAVIQQTQGLPEVIAKSANAAANHITGSISRVAADVATTASKEIRREVTDIAAEISRQIANVDDLAQAGVREGAEGLRKVLDQHVRKVEQMAKERAESLAQGAAAEAMTAFTTASIFIPVAMIIAALVGAYHLGTLSAFGVSGWWVSGFLLVSVLSSAMFLFQDGSGYGPWWYRLWAGGGWLLILVVAVVKGIAML